MPKDELEPLITSAEAARILGIGPATLRKWRWANQGPAFIRFGDGERGRVMYAPSAIRTWIESRTIGRAS